MKLNFDKASGIPIPTLIPTATPANAASVAAGNLNPISCTAQITTSGWVLIIPGLAPQSTKYTFTIQNIKNPPSGNLVTPQQVQCQLCAKDDPTCAVPLLQSLIQGTITFAAAAMQANTIKIKSDSLTNGEDAATFTMSITLNQPLPANAGLEITLPKANINYIVLAGVPA